MRGFGSLPSGYAFYQGIRVLLLMGAVLLLGPVIIFIVMATRVAAAHREQRLAAIRLVGATRLQAAVVAAVETGLGAVAGTALGWAGYEVGRRILAATVTFQGARFFLDDVVVALAPGTGPGRGAAPRDADHHRGAEPGPGRTARDQPAWPPSAAVGPARAAARRWHRRPAARRAAAPGRR